MIRNYKLLFLSMFFVLVSVGNFHGYSFSDKTKAYTIIDYNTGKILSHENGEIKLYPASLTKLMTLFVLFDKMADNKIKLTDKIVISKEAAALPPSKLGLPAGSTISVQDAIISIIVRSNNDIARAVAEHVSGAESNFVELMNQKAQELGLNSTHFANSHGLHNPDNYSTANDIAKLSRILMIKHNAYYGLFSISDFAWNRSKYLNTNKLLEYNGIDGIKTGYTGASGFNLVTSAYNKDNNRIIAVVMGFNTASGRDEYMKSVIDVGFEIADISRKNDVTYISKPKSLKQDLLISEGTIEGLKENAIKNSYDVKTYNASIDDSNLYTIDHLPYIEKIKSKDQVIIKPIVKAPPKASRKYAIQVGAFSTYNAALRNSYNVANIRATSKVLQKNKIQVFKRNGNYISRFSSLTRNEAYNSCNLLKSKGADCFVIKT